MGPPPDPPPAPNPSPPPPRAHPPRTHEIPACEALRAVAVSPSGGWVAAAARCESSHSPVLGSYRGELLLRYGPDGEAQRAVLTDGDGVAAGWTELHVGDDGAVLAHGFYASPDGSRCVVPRGAGPDAAADLTGGSPFFGVVIAWPAGEGRSPRAGCRVAVGAASLRWGRPVAVEWGPRPRLVHLGPATAGPVGHRELAPMPRSGATGISALVPDASGRNLLARVDGWEREGDGGAAVLPAELAEPAPLPLIPAPGVRTGPGCAAVVASSSPVGGWLVPALAMAGAGGAGGRWCLVSPTGALRRVGCYWDGEGEAARALLGGATPLGAGGLYGSPDGGVYALRAPPGPAPPSLGRICRDSAAATGRPVLWAAGALGTRVVRGVGPAPGEAVAGGGVARLDAWDESTEGLYARF